MSAAEKTFVGSELEATLPPPRPVTYSGIELPVVATAADHDPGQEGLPGQFPFTRGIFPDGYRGRL